MLAHQKLNCIIFFFFFVKFNFFKSNLPSLYNLNHETQNNDR